MSRYRKIDPRIWLDEKVKSLSVEGRILWLYLLSGPDANSIGIYRFSTEKAAEDIGVPTPSVRREFNHLSAKKMVYFDQGCGLVFLPNWFRYNSPDGSNQAKGYLAQIKLFLPHRFAVAGNLFLLAYIPSIPGLGSSIITKRQSIIIRDRCQCQYCKSVITQWDQAQIDHVIPASRKAENGKYEDLVLACKSCNAKKLDKTAEEFGYPFVRGYEYSITKALIRLLSSQEIRKRFTTLCGGLPQELAKCDSVSDLLEGHLNDDDMAFEGASNAIRTQEQEQEQEQHQDQESHASHGCDEPARPASTPPASAGKVVIVFSCVGGRRQAEQSWNLTQAEIDQLAKLYPGVNVPLEAAKAKKWTEDNPTRRKTASGMSNFLSNWMKREQNRSTGPHYQNRERGLSRDGNITGTELERRDNERLGVSPQIKLVG